MARRRAPAHTSGFLNIDKPPGWTSHDVVARVRRIVGERRVGHAGTLDPAATGVLPIAVGHATKLLSYLEDSDKTYVAAIRLGVETDSGDRDGRLIATASPDDVQVDDVKRVLSHVIGPQDQVPPMHSAIRVNGRHLYELARQGEAVDVPVRNIHLYECALVSWEPPEASIRVVCSKGTYVRSLARDIGVKLGCGAMLANLVRVRAGPFHLASSVSIHDLEARFRRHGWEYIALHPDFVIQGQEVAILTVDEEQRWFNGQEVGRRLERGGDVRVHDANGMWIGVGMIDVEESCLRPKRVIRESTQ